jgi:hypothetical protein
VLELGDTPGALLAFEREGRDAAAAGLGVGHREHHERSRDAPVGDELFGAADHVLVAVALRLRAHGGGVGA